MTGPVVNDLRNTAVGLLRGISAEFAKLSPRMALFWLVIPAAIVIPVTVNYGIALAVQSQNLDGSGGVDTDNAAYWILLFTPFILMSSAVTSFCSEFRDSTVELSAAVQPRRSILPLSKLVAFGVLSALTSAVAVFVILWGFPYLFPEIWGRVDLLSPEGLRLWIGIPVYTVLVVALGLGLSVLIPRPSVVILAVVLWKFGVELLFPRIATTSVGDFLQRYAPFANAEVGVGQYATFDPPFGPNASLLYFAAIATAIFLLGLLRLTRRDLS